MKPNEMRASAKALVQGALDRMAKANPPLTPSEQTVISVVTDQVNAYTLMTLADIVETVNPDVKKAQVKKYVDDRLAQVKASQDEANAVRQAAAKGFSSGDYSDFDRLVDATGQPPATNASAAGA